MNGTLPRWIQRLLGLDVGPGEGASWHLEDTWSWAPWATVLLVAFLVIFVLLIYSREGRRVRFGWKAVLVSIRLTLIGIVLLMIAQFMLCVDRTGLPYFAVVLDDSASMTIVDQHETKDTKRLTRRLEKVGLANAPLSRENLAKMLLLEDREHWLRRFTRDYKLRFYYLTGPHESRADNLEHLGKELRHHKANGQATRLGTTMNRVLDDLRGTTPAGIVLLTDGINTEGPPLAKATTVARRRGVPFFIVGLGDDRPIADVRLTDLLVDDVVFVDDVVLFEVTLVATGCQGQQLRITLCHEGHPDVLAETNVMANDEGRPQTVQLRYRPIEVGRQNFTVEVEPLEGELQTDNNRLSCSIQVRKEQIRVLLVQAYPNFEYRYLRKTLDRDETIQLHTLLQEADLEHAEQDAAALAVFPVRREELLKYDVVILGDVDFKRLGEPAMHDLASLVDRPTGGGALVFLAGPEYDPMALRGTPLEPLLPLSLSGVVLPRDDVALTEGFVVEPTALGLANPAMQLGNRPAETEAIWASLPPLYWMIEAQELKPGVRVLAVNPRQLGHDGQPLPVICIQYVGASKVLMHMTDETWRWRHAGGERYFARYWVQMIRYLARSKLLDNNQQAVLTTDRRTYRQGETVRFRLRFADPHRMPSGTDNVVLTVEQEGQRTRRVPMTRHVSHDMFEAALDNVSSGRYHAWVAGTGMEGSSTTVDFSVTQPAGEFENIQMKAAQLQRTAEQTRGGYYTIDTAKKLIRELPPGRQVPIESLPPVPLWNRWPLLVLFLVLLIAEWILRKMKGMA